MKVGKDYDVNGTRRENEFVEGGGKRKTLYIIGNVINLEQRLNK